MPFVADEIVTAAKLNLATGLGTAGNSDTRTFTNTSFLDLDALTGGTGTVAAVAVTITTGTSVLILITATLRNQTAAADAFLGFRVSGATTLAASAGTAMRVGLRDTALPTSTYHTVLAGLTAGSNTFELQASVVSNIGQLGSPRLTVITIA